MNPDTNRFEPVGFIKDDVEKKLAAIEARYNSQLLRSDGTPVPRTWTVFSVGELVEIKGYTFKVAYIGETAILFEPVSPSSAPILDAIERREATDG